MNMCERLVFISALFWSISVRNSERCGMKESIMQGWMSCGAYLRIGAGDDQVGSCLHPKALVRITRLSGIIMPFPVLDFPGAHSMDWGERYIWLVFSLWSLDQLYHHSLALALPLQFSLSRLCSPSPTPAPYGPRLGILEPVYRL